MSEIDNGPVVVTGEERRHPAIRVLARACIAIARLRLERKAATTAAGEGEPGVADEPAQEGDHA